MNHSNNMNLDLIWSLGAEEYCQQVARFLRRFESRLCVFSSKVDQLYSNYELMAVHDEQSKMVVLPNPYAYHDTFNHVDSEAVVPTGMFIIPGEASGGGGLMLAYRSQNTGRLNGLPLGQALKRIQSQCSARHPFLPVIMNTDLQMIEDRKPVMHLHRVKLQRLQTLSEFQREDLSESIQEKMAALAA